MKSRPSALLISLVLAQACGTAETAAPHGSSSSATGSAGSVGTKAGGPAVATMTTGTSKGTSGGTTATSPATGTAGSKAPSNQPAPTNPATTATTPTTTSSGLAMDECGLKTQWKGDEYCIKPPPVDKGFQVHIGPTNYDTPEAQYILQPGGEVTENFSATSGNANDVFYYFRQYRMRPGSHHMIVTANGKRLGGSQNLAKDNPDRGEIAPENMGVGMKLAAKSPLNISLHYLNSTDKPILKEVWVNFWYRDAKDVTEPSNEIFSMSPMNVAPGTHVVIHGVCPITGAGRILTLYGHRHANNVRFSAWRERGGEKDLVFDDYNWEEPLVLEYSSLIKNAPADPANKAPGGWSGVLDLANGDNMVFECDIVNMTNNTFRGLNEAHDDEMCILVGDSVGTSVPARCTYTTQMK